MDAHNDIEEMLLLLSSEKFRQHIDAFGMKLAENDPTSQFWWQYMDMVGILLMFIRAQRDGLWDLHLYAFRRMLPFYFRYDHTHYARWGTVYLSEMNRLPQEVLQEFQEGNFVVKESERRFSQVEPDHSQEWLNGTGKKSGGIIGITRTVTALSKWALSFYLRSYLASSTRQMLDVEMEHEYVHNDLVPSRIRRDNSDENTVASNFQRFHVFDTKSDKNPPELRNIATKDVATEGIRQSLLCAENLGQEQLEDFVAQRLVQPPDSPGHTEFHSPLHRNKAQTFSTLYDVDKESNKTVKEKTVKADRGILQRLVIAYEAGRPVNLQQILQHELMPVPISLAAMNGSLLSGNKSLLADTLASNVSTPANIKITGTASLVIDGQALVMALGKPPGVSTFGNYADVFMKSVLDMGAEFDRIDLVFDRYDQASIKAGTRKKRTRGIQPVRRVIESDSVPLPDKWINFISLAENKENLAQFLSEYIMKRAQSLESKTLVVGGGFKEVTDVQSSDANMDLSLLKAVHEEADTRLILHCIHSNTETVVVSARDTDVLALLIAHFEKMDCN